MFVLLFADVVITDVGNKQAAMPQRFDHPNTKPKIAFSFFPSPESTEIQEMNVDSKIPDDWDISCASLLMKLLFGRQISKKQIAFLMSLLAQDDPRLKEAFDELRGDEGDFLKEMLDLCLPLEEDYDDEE